VIVYFVFEHGLWGLGEFGNERVFDYGAIPEEITHPGTNCFTDPTMTFIQCRANAIASGQPPYWVTVFTSMFLHGSLLHLGGNMLFLWIFGNNIEDSMNRLVFIGFYILGGLAALALQVVTDPNSVVPTVGASGAIAGVMGAYLLKFPRANIRTLVFIIVFVTTADLPAFVILIYWFAIQLSSGYGSIAHTQVTDAGVAWFAHIGGFLAGMAIVNLIGTRTRYYRRRDIYWN